MKTAVFLDWENLNIKTESVKTEIPALLEKISQSDISGEIILIRVYISKSNSAFIGLKTELQKLNIELVGVEPLAEAKKKANLVDLKMGVDVIATIAAKRSIATVAIGSGDSDFGFLCQQVKRMNRNLIVISNHLTTGDSLYKICDDYYSTQMLSPTNPQFIFKMINLRHTKTYLIQAQDNKDYINALTDFLKNLENDMFIRRYLTKYGLPFGTFNALLESRKIICHNYQSLGFLSMSTFMETLLCDTNFECKCGHVKYAPNKTPVSQFSLAKNYLRIPDGYTREKLLMYYDVLNELNSIEEFTLYVGFMRRSGMIVDNKLCQRRTFRSSVRSHIKTVMEKAGLKLSDDTIEKIDKIL